TLFEYLMPSLWMRSYSNTLLERSRATAVRSQQTYAARKGVPWGISESAYFKPTLVRFSLWLPFLFPRWIVVTCWLRSGLCSKGASSGYTSRYCNRVCQKDSSTISVCCPLGVRFHESCSRP